MRTIANNLKSKGISIINFSAGELDFDTSDNLKNAVIGSVGENKYTETIGIALLREMLAKQLSQTTNIEYASDEIAVTAGAKQALFNTCFSLFEKNDDIIIPIPAWSTYHAQVKLCDANFVNLDTRDSQYQIDIKKLESLITKNTKAIIVNTPNNPTGIVYNETTLLSIAKLALKYDFWIIFDECYKQITYSTNHHVNIIKLSPEMKRKTVIVGSFSKTFAITGWRIGYMAAPKEVIESVKIIQGHTTSNPSSLSQHAALASFEDNVENKMFLNYVLETLNRRREIIVKLLSEIPNISFPIPQGGFYIYINISRLIGKTINDIIIKNVNHFVELLLEIAKLSIVPGDAFHDEKAVRLSYAISTDDIREGIARFKNFILNLK